MQLHTVTRSYTVEMSCKWLQMVASSCKRMRKRDTITNGGQTHSFITSFTICIHCTIDSRQSTRVDASNNVSKRVQFNFNFKRFQTVSNCFEHLSTFFYIWKLFNLVQPGSTWFSQTTKIMEVNCAICLDPLQGNRVIATPKTCLRHIFHLDCILTWIHGYVVQKVFNL